jgi:predicted O-linked N-acetylglucosamine transferase (SPINDLY family)
MAFRDLQAALAEAIELARRGEFARAERALEALLEQDPTVARAYNVLGVVQLELGKSAAAEATLLSAARLAPEDAKVQLNLGKLYVTLARPAVAERHLREAVRLDPRGADGHFNLAVFLRAHDRPAEAEAAFRRVVEVAPGDAEAHYLLGRMLLEAFRFEEAETHFRQALRLRPDHAVARNDLAMVLLETGRLAEAQEALRETVRVSPGFLRARSNYVMSGQYDPDATDAELLERALETGRAIQAAGLGFPEAPPFPVRRGTLSIGFVSSDLHHHPVGLFLLPLLQRLRRREDVRAVLYSSGTVHDEVSRQLGELAEWMDIAQHSDEEAWTRIRRDSPDVLIDLAGHTGNNRLAVFAARAAPVQISWLGYFATTGTPNMDYVLMDPWHAPAGCEGQFSERILRLPHTRFCFQPLASAPEVAPPPSASRGRITFGSFNSIAKLNERVIELWSRVLRGVPGSRLVLKWRTLANSSFRGALAARFERLGVAPGRIELRPASEHSALLAEYGDIDIALDPYPFTGGQTSFEAHWMGVPVVTLAGARPVSRQTLCILGNLGMADQAAHTDDVYVERACMLAEDPQRLSELRSSLRAKMSSSALMDAEAFSRAFVEVVRSAA